MSPIEIAELVLVALTAGVLIGIDIGVRYAKG